MLASSWFVEGLARSRCYPEKAGEMLDELATGWSRFSVDLLPNLGRSVFSRGFDPNIDYDHTGGRDDAGALETHPAVLLSRTGRIWTASSFRVAMQENHLPPVHTFAGINLSFGSDGPV